MPTYDGIGSSVTHEIEVVGDVFISNVEGGSLSTQVPFEIFSNVSGMVSPPTDSRQLRLRVQPTTEASPDDSYVTDMGIQNTTDNYFFITAPQNTSSVGDQNTFVISSTSNVGIGTTNPTSTLHVVGNELITGTLTASNIVGGSPLTITSDQNLQVNSNLTVGTSNLFVNNLTGNVGIGTASPVAKLDVAGSSTSGKSLQLRSGDVLSGTDSSQIIFSYDGNPYNAGGYAHSIRTRHNSNADTGNAIDFWLWNTSDTADSNTLGNKRVMTIEGNGNVGIGVASPIRRLDVRSGTSSTTNTTDWISGTFGPQLNDGDRVVIGNLFTKATIGAHNSSLGAWADLTINSAGGNVGIGTSATPACRLDVRGGGTLSPVVEFGDNGSIISFVPSTKAGSSGTYTGWTSIDPNRRSSTGSTGIAVWDAFHVQGTFTATNGKGFIIDHPTNPKTKKLVHVSVESPRLDLMYRGSATLQNGTCVININKDSVGSPDCEMEDGTFEALCRDPVYYLQNTSGFDRVIGKIEGSNLTITSENQTSTDVINWMVIAERKDREIKVASSTYDDGRLITEIFDDSIRVDKQGNTIYDE
jgi:hypothetical protein